MSYQTIAAKYRPISFKDLVGQESVALALTGSIRQSRIPSGVIFSGTRGVGKTSVARIYAKALNCKGDSAPEPCGVCSSCVAIAEGHHEDVVEIDGASNNGVDEVRALRESTAYVPQRSRFRIFIIDEVHMLSLSAFNALLKTLEEPPSHVVFLFATTEIEKIPQTVVSRCQVFRLQKISQKNIETRIKIILEKEEITWEEGILPILAREGRGSLRDALTFLDQVIAISGSHLTKNSLEKVLGELSERPYLLLLESLLKKDSTSLLKSIDTFDDRAESFVKIVTHLAKLTRHAFVIKALGVPALVAEAAELEEDDLVFLQALARDYEFSLFHVLFRKLVSCLDDLKDSSLDRYIVENLCLEFCLGTFSSKIETTKDVQPVYVLAKDDSKKENSKPSLVKSLSSFAEESEEKSRKLEFSKELKKEEHKDEEFSSKVFEQAPVFPSTWKDLVARWMVIKPLQARKLEELIPCEYSPEKILLLVDETSLLGPTFLKEETRKKVALVLAKLFNFHGEFLVKSKAQFKTEENLSVSESYSTFSGNESLLDEKTRLLEERKEKARKDLHENELTKGLCENYSGIIVETVVKL